MSLVTLLIVVLLVLLIVGAFPAWPHAVAWGYGPSGGLTVILLIILVLVAAGRI